MAIRRSIYDSCGGFDTSLTTAEDIDLARRAAKFAKIRFLPNLMVGVSPRRIDKWGVLYYTYFHLKNFFKFAFFRKII